MNTPVAKSRVWQISKILQQINIIIFINLTNKHKTADITKFITVIRISARLLTKHKITDRHSGKLSPDFYGKMQKNPISDWAPHQTLAALKGP